MKPRTALLALAVLLLPGLSFAATKQCCCSTKSLTKQERMQKLVDSAPLDAADRKSLTWAVGRVDPARPMRIYRDASGRDVGMTFTVKADPATKTVVGTKYSLRLTKGGSVARRSYRDEYGRFAFAQDRTTKGGTNLFVVNSYKLPDSDQVVLHDSLAPSGQTSTREWKAPKSK